MCGIVGYVGQASAQDILTSGLRRLEYRGYDSAGVVTVSADNKATLLRTKGKVEQLEALVTEQTTSDTIGIGHTRWATHGEPSERNAHPHQSGDIFLVHNGIIENYQELKAKLSDATFASDTDSEVLAALINSFYSDSTSLVEAVTQALQLVVGTYGIAVLSSRQPDTIIVARKGSPLIIGVGDNETIIASDASALLGHTSQAIYLNDGEIAECTASDVRITDLGSTPLPAMVEQIEGDLQSIHKGGYDHFLVKEINEQPETLQATLNGRVLVDERRVKLGGLNMEPAELAALRHITIAGCGTAYYAGLLASYYIEQLLDDVTVEVVVASEFRYRSFHLPENSVGLIVSQSGETADTLACLREIKSRGVKALGIVNAVGSTIAREVDGGIYVHAGPEISVASTKAFTSQVSAMIMFGLAVAEAKGVSAEHTGRYIEELVKLPAEIKSVLEQVTEPVKTIAEQYAHYDHALYVGRDTMYPAALEGALKLKEISYIQADGIAAGELKHGSLALVDDRFFEVFYLQTGRLFEKSMSNLSEIKARGGHVIVVTDSQDALEVESLIPIKTELKLLTPLVFNVAMQLLAYYVAVQRGNDVDQPRNLAKSVTVE